MLGWFRILNNFHCVEIFFVRHASGVKQKDEKQAQVSGLCKRGI
jgi:hypothetical protein